MGERQCAFCGSSGPLTREHLWPAALHSRLMSVTDDKVNCFWLRRIDREIEAEPTIRDVCAECNNVRLSSLDNYICELFDKILVRSLDRYEEIQFEFDYHLLKRWLLKMCLNSARVHAALDVIAFPPLLGSVAGLVGIEGGVVSGVFNLESSGVEAPDWRPRHDEHYHEA